MNPFDPFDPRQPGEDEARPEAPSRYVSETTPYWRCCGALAPPALTSAWVADWQGQSITLTFAPGREDDPEDDLPETFGERPPFSDG